MSKEEAAIDESVHRCGPPRSSILHPRALWKQDQDMFLLGSSSDEETIPLRRLKEGTPAGNSMVQEDDDRKPPPVYDRKPPPVYDRKPPPIQNGRSPDTAFDLTLGGVASDKENKKKKSTRKGKKKRKSSSVSSWTKRSKVREDVNHTCTATKCNCTKAPVVARTYPEPYSFFPQALPDDEREDSGHRIVFTVNHARACIINYIREGEKGRKKTVDYEGARNMKQFLVDDVLPELRDLLRTIPCLPCRQEKSTILRAHVRDRFANVGIGYILCGYALLWMGGVGHEHGVKDPVAGAAHLGMCEKFLYSNGVKKDYMCNVCCYSSDDCLNTTWCRDVVDRDFSEIQPSKDYYNDYSDEEDQSSAGRASDRGDTDGDDSKNYKYHEL